MDNAIYSITSGKLALENELSVITNNSANSGAAGYKADMLLLKQRTTQDVYDTNTMPYDSSTIIDYTPGSSKMTGRALDLAIQGDGFFVVNTPLGVRYTRAGNFTLNKDRALVTAQGYPVLSFAGDEIYLQDSSSEPIVQEDGSIYVMIDNIRQELGVIGVVDFDNPKLLRKVGESLFISDAPPIIGQKYKVMQGMIEESNAEPILQMTKLMELQQHSTLLSSLANEIYSMRDNAYRAFGKQN